MIKTAIENRQNLIVEGSYIPFDWKKDFPDSYLEQIRYYCLVMTEAYIESHFDEIKKHADDIEARLDDSWCTKESVLQDNAYNFKMCKRHGCNCILIDGSYHVDIEL